MKFLISSILSILLPTLVFPVTVFNENCRNAYKDIICLKIEDARQKITAESKNHPGNTITFLLQNYIDFIRVITSEEQPAFETLKNNRDIHLQGVAKGDQNSPWTSFSQAEIYFQLGLSKLKFGEYLSAGLDLNRAYRLFEDNQKRFPDFMPGKVRMGLMHALIGAVPDKYAWALDALDFEGSVPQGIKELSVAYKACLSDKNLDYLVPESAFLCSYVLVNLSPDHSGAKEFIGEYEKNPLNDWIRLSPLVCMSYVNLLMKTGSNNKAIAAVELCNRGDGRMPLYFLDYLLGIAKLNRLDVDAHLPFLTFLAKFRGLNYIKSAYQHLAWYYLLNNDPGHYRVYMERIGLRGGDLVDNDKQALFDYKQNVRPNEWLLKARLLFDGGYYEKADEVLSSFRGSDYGNEPQLKLEYVYRRGRIYDEWGRKAEAAGFYSQAAELGKDDPSFYAANAALHLGMIYELQGKYPDAAKAYNECLSMKGGKDNFGISLKAKAGLNRIKNGKK